MKAFDIQLPSNCCIGDTGREVEHVLDTGWVLERADGYFSGGIIRCIKSKKRDLLVEDLVGIGIQPTLLDKPHKEPRVELSKTWWFKEWAEQEQREWRKFHGRN